MSARYWSRLWLTVAAMLWAPAATAGARSETIRVEPVAEGVSTAEVRHHAGLPWKRMGRRDELRLGELFRCNQGCRVRAPDGSKIDLDPGAVIAAASHAYFRFDRRADARATRSTVLTLLSGTIRVTRASDGSTPLVIAPRSSAPIALLERGSHAWIRAVTDGAAVAPINGTVSVRTGRTWHALSTGDTHRVAKNGTTTERARVVAARWSEASRDHRPIALAVDGPIAPVDLAWAAVIGAARYRVEIARDPVFADIAALVQTSDVHAAVRLPEGRYWAQVRTFDADDLEAPHSTKLAVRVLRAALSDGAFMPDARTLVVPEGRSVRLLDASDIEVAVDKSGFYPAPGELHAPLRADRTLRLRLSGEPASVTDIAFERRALRAMVRVAAASATWPDDAIQVEVRLADPTGRIDPRAVIPRLAVKVGGVPLSIDWALDGDVWRARIPGRAITGPTLVEIVARDEHGTSLGTGYLEMVGSAATHADRDAARVSALQSAR